MKNRTVTGHWDGETISRPKTLGERHPHMMKPKHKVLEHTHSEGKIKLKKPRMLTAEESREKMKNWPSAHSKALTKSEERSYQNRIGRAYSE